MAWQAYDANIVADVFSAKLCTKSNAVCLFGQCLFEFYIAEGASSLITCRRQVVIEMGRCQFHGEQVALNAGTSDDKCYVIRWTSSGTECLHLLYEEGHEFLRIEQCFGLLIEVGFIGRATTFCNEEETVFHTFGCFDINLCWQVATCVHLFVHGERCILRIAQVFFSIDVIDTARERLFVAISCPYMLSFLAVDDGSTCVLTYRKQSFCRYFSVAEHGQCHVFIVV